MKDTMLREILKEYNELRSAKEQSLRDRETEVFKKIPEILNIRNNMVSLLAEQSRALIQSPNPDNLVTDSIKNQIATLKEKEMLLLKLHDFPLDYMTINFECTHCRDTGFVGDLVKEKCKCLLQKIIDRTYHYSEIHELETQNFSTFDIKVFPGTFLKEVSLTQQEYMQKIRSGLFDYQSNFPTNKQKTILFTGKTGLGKTFLLNCLAKAILDKRYTVLKITSYNLFEQLFRSNRYDDTQAQSLKDRIFQVDTLIIDDLGTETKRNNFTAEELFNILNERSLARKNTFISTNLMLTELKECYSDRVTSRLFDTSNTIIIRFLGQDIRLKSRQNS